MKIEICEFFNEEGVLVRKTANGIEIPLATPYPQDAVIHRWFSNGKETLALIKGDIKE